MRGGPTGHWPLRPSAQSLDLRLPQQPRWPIRNSQFAIRPIPLKEDKGSRGPKYILPCTLYDPKQHKCRGANYSAPFSPFRDLSAPQKVWKSDRRVGDGLRNIGATRLHSIQIMTVNG